MDYQKKSQREVAKTLEVILIVLLIAWLLGGLALPTSGALINIILVVVLIYVVLKLFNRI